MNDFIVEVREPSLEEKRAIDLRPSGQEIFDSMTAEEQDVEFGADLAAALRAGDVELADLIKRDGTFITRTNPLAEED